MVHQHLRNPFSARYLVPGHGEFVLPTTGLSRGLSRDSYLQALARRFRQANLVGQIVGPHGCGKSTLAHAMLSCLGKEFSDFRWITIRKKKSLRGGVSPAIHAMLSDLSGGHPKTLLLLDGFEILSWVNRMLLIANVRIGKMGLLLTTHQRHAGIRVIEKLQPSQHHFLKIARSKCVGCGTSTARISNSVIEKSYISSHEDYREALMKLYDYA